MAYALAEASAAGRVELLVRIDERSAGFTALGLALATGAPAAVLTTSGTAVGNLLPAVMEANHAAVPLVVLSADRPEELRGTGANQTTVQLDLFGEHVRFAVDVPAGDSPQRAVETALAAATGAFEDTPPGPVQLNLAFRDPLVPEAGERLPEQRGHGTFRIGTEPLTMSLTHTTADLPERRTVVLAGHDAGPVAEAFARAHGLPLLAEPSSNSRFGPNAVGPYRLLLEHFGPDSAQPIERAVVFGRPTLSRPVSALLARTDVPAALYEPVPVAWYEPGRRRETPDRQPDRARRVRRPGLRPPGSTHGCSRVPRPNMPSTAYSPRPRRQPGPPSAPLSGSSPAASWSSAHPTASATWTSPASPHPNRPPRSSPAGTCRDRRHHFHRNRHRPRRPPGNHPAARRRHLPARRRRPSLAPERTAAAAHRGPQRLWRRHLQPPGTRRGAEAGGYGDAVERLFGTPHSVDLAALAAAYGVGHCSVSTTAGLAEALAVPFTGRTIIEVRTDRHELRALHGGSSPQWARQWPGCSPARCLRPDDAGRAACAVEEAQLVKGKASVQ